jgi:hypothetical protein
MKIGGFAIVLLMLVLAALIFPARLWRRRGSYHSAGVRA